MSFCKIFLLLGIMFFSATMFIPAIHAQEVVQKITAGTEEQTTMSGIIKFFTYAANEEERTRKKTGLQVLGFLIVFAFIMGRVKKNIWKDRHKNINVKE